VDKDMRTVVNDALQRGWSYRTTANGHLLMTHERGGSVTIPSKVGSHRGIKNAVALLRQTERKNEEVQVEPAVELEWRPVNDRYDRRPLNGGWEYRCTICGRTGLLSHSAAGGHYSRAHSEKKYQPKGIPRPRKKKLTIVAASAAPIPVQDEEIMDSTDLAARIAALLDKEIAVMKALQADNERLTKENKRLRETLTTLAQLAGEMDA